MAVSPIHWVLLGHTYAVELDVCAPSKMANSYKSSIFFLNVLQRSLYGFGITYSKNLVINLRLHSDHDHV